jgi:hypothetical protein
MKTVVVLLSALSCTAAFGAASNTVNSCLALYHQAVESKNIDEIIIRHKELCELNQGEAFKVSQSDPRLLAFIAELKPEKYEEKTLVLSIFRGGHPVSQAIIRGRWEELAQLAANLEKNKLIEEIPINESSNTEQPAQSESHTDAQIDQKIMELSAAITQGYKHEQDKQLRRTLLTQLNNVSELIATYIQQPVDQDTRDRTREQIRTSLEQISRTLEPLRTDSAEEDFIASAERFNTCVTILTEQAIVERDVEMLHVIANVTDGNSELGQGTRAALTRMDNPASQSLDNDDDDALDPDIQAAIAESRQQVDTPPIQQEEELFEAPTAEMSSGLRTFLCWGTVTVAAAVAVGAYFWWKFKK